jgi:formate hydrogenlyase transcriptional activator
MVDDGRFRSDLFYRLNVFPISLPALRNRVDDIPRLIRYFTNLFSVRMGRRIETIPLHVIDYLCRYSWPGNIRELQNVIERAVILSQGTVLHVSLDDLRIPAETPNPSPASPRAARSAMPIGSRTSLADAERNHIIAALEQASWVLGGPHGAAELLGVKRTTLQKKMKKLGIERPE